MLSDALPPGKDAGSPYRFVLESVQLLAPQEAEKILPVFKQFIYFASLATHIAQEEKRKAEEEARRAPHPPRRIRGLGNSRS